MHIGILTACYAPVVNGVTRLVTLYEKYLRAAGHQVTIFTLGQPMPGEDAATVVRSTGIGLGQTGYHLALGYSHIAQRKLQRVDILHSHHLLMGLEFASRYGNAPIVFTNHTRYDLYLSSYGRVPRRIADRVMNFAWPRLTGLADTVIAPSNSIASRLRSGGVSTPIEVIENGVEVERFRRDASHGLRAELHIPGDAVVLAYVGRIAPEKNIERLIDEFRLAAGQQNDIYLVCVGGGPMLEKVAAMAEGYGLISRTRFVGPVEPDEVPAYLAMSDVFVSASVSEVHPLTVIEALASELPVLAVDAPGMNDIIVSDESGLLVSQSKGSLARAMCAIAGDSTLRNRLATGARAAGRRYDIQNTVERTLALYRRLLDQQGDGIERVDASTRSGSMNGLPRRERISDVSASGRGGSSG